MGDSLGRADNQGADSRGPEEDSRQGADILQEEDSLREAGNRRDSRVAGKTWLITKRVRAHRGAGRKIGQVRECSSKAERAETRRSGGRRTGGRRSTQMTTRSFGCPQLSCEPLACIPLHLRNDRHSHYSVRKMTDVYVSVPRSMNCVWRRSARGG